MADDEIERWISRRDMYHLRRAPEEVRQAARAAARIINGEGLAGSAMQGMVSVHHGANAIVRDNPDLEFAVRDLEATFQVGCIAAIRRYLLG